MARRPRLPEVPNLTPAELRKRQEDYWTERRPKKLKHDPQRPTAAELKRRQTAYWDAIVMNHIHLTAEWQGWRMAGRYLVSPTGERITPERLRGLLFTEDSRERIERNRAKREGAAKTARIHFLPARERFEGSA